MIFKIEYATSTSSFVYEVENDTPDIQAVMNGVEAFLNTVTQVVAEDCDEESIQEELNQLNAAKAKAELYQAADEIIEETYGYYGEGKL